MVDAIFTDRRLAAVYDAFDDDRGDLGAYEAIVRELGATRILDVGCGTGSLAVRLAKAGSAVTAVDPAEASLEVARAKPGGETVTWLSGYADAVGDAGADLALMTGNAAQALLTDAAWDLLLSGVGRALRPGGHFVFEARRPERRIWEVWQSAPSTAVRDIPEIGRVERDFAVTEVHPPFVSFRHTFRFARDGATLESESTLWFRDREDLERTLLTYDFTTLAVREAPDRPGLENVFLTHYTPVHEFFPAAPGIQQGASWRTSSAAEGAWR